jgi:hypothetical protein
MLLNAHYFLAALSVEYAAEEFQISRHDCRFAFNVSHCFQSIENECRSPEKYATAPSPKFK